MYSSFPWDTHVLTLEGPKPIQIGSSQHPDNSSKFQLTSNIYENISTHLSEKLSRIQRQRGNNLNHPGTGRFQIRSCNIQDPVDPFNNLGISVSRPNLLLFSKALSLGYQHLESICTFLLQHLQLHSSNQVSLSLTNVSIDCSSISHPVNISSPAQVRSNKILTPQCHPISQSVLPPDLSLPPAQYGGGNVVLGVNDFQPPALSGRQGSQKNSFVNNPSDDNGKKRGSFNVTVSANCWYQNQFLTDCLPRSFAKFIHNLSIRSDLLDHPLQIVRSSGPNIESSKGSNDALVGDSFTIKSFLDGIENESNEPVKVDYSYKKEVLESISDELLVVDHVEDFSAIAIPDKDKSPKKKKRQSINAQGNYVAVDDKSNDRPQKKLPQSTDTEDKQKQMSQSNKKAKKHPELKLISPSKFATIIDIITDIWVFIQMNSCPFLISFALSFVIIGLVWIILLPSIKYNPTSTLTSIGALIQHDIISEHPSPSKCELEESSVLHKRKNYKDGLSDKLTTFWVQFGDSITFGDFSEYNGYFQTGQFPMHSTNFLWRKDNATVALTPQPFFSLSKISWDDAGHYQCFKVNKNLGIEQAYSSSFLELVTETIIRVSSKCNFISLSITFKLTPASFTEKPKVITRPFYHEVKEGKSLLLTLDVEGVPPPTFQWYRNGYLIKYQVYPHLIIDSASGLHEGTYSCEVKNIAGKVMWLEATVHVQSRDQEEAKLSQP
jgi:hypothetical protein